MRADYLAVIGVGAALRHQMNQVKEILFDGMVRWYGQRLPVLRGRELRRFQDGGSELHVPHGEKLDEAILVLVFPALLENNTFRMCMALFNVLFSALSIKLTRGSSLSSR